MPSRKYVSPPGPMDIHEVLIVASRGRSIQKTVQRRLLELLEPFRNPLQAHRTDRQRPLSRRDVSSRLGEAGTLSKGTDIKRIRPVKSVYRAELRRAPTTVQEQDQNPG
jgi:hypothetical protein